MCKLVADVNTKHTCANSGDLALEWRKWPFHAKTVNKRQYEKFVCECGVTGKVWTEWSALCRSFTRIATWQQTNNTQTYQSTWICQSSAVYKFYKTRTYRIRHKGSDAIQSSLASSTGRNHCVCIARIGYNQHERAREKERERHSHDTHIIFCAYFRFVDVVVVWVQHYSLCDSDAVSRLASVCVPCC